MGGKRGALKRTPVRWAPEGERDLGGVLDHGIGDAHVGVRRLVEGILAVADRLARHPLIGPRDFVVEPEGDLRRVIWRDYSVYYRVRDDVVVILRIWHSSRDPAALRVPT